MWSRRSARPARCRSRRVRRWSQRAMAERFGLSRRKVSQLIADVTIESNGYLLAGKAV
jgi:transcriptional regulator with XRE-family HTH domain